MIMDNDKLALQAAIKMLLDVDRAKLRIVRIQDTLHIGEVLVSEAMLMEARSIPQVEVIGLPEDMLFNADGNLF
jgi:hypothetical protein